MNPNNRSITTVKRNLVPNADGQILGPNPHRRGLILSGGITELSVRHYGWGERMTGASGELQMAMGAAPFRLCVYQGDWFIQGSLYAFDANGDSIGVVEIVEIPNSAQENNNNDYF